MGLVALLQERKEAVLERWVDAILATYPGKGAALFRGQRDPFANPVGHGIRTGTRGVLDALLAGDDVSAVREALRDIVSIRCVQQFPPSVAVGFVLGLKGAIRAVLAVDLDDPGLERKMVALEERIDGAALVAFDLYLECRERVSELRINEVKRRVAWVVERANREAPPGEPAPAGAGKESG